MLKRSLVLAALILIPSVVSAENLGSVTKVLRPSIRTFDAQGQPLAPVAAADIKTPAPIVGYGVGHSIGLNVKGKVVYVRGLDVQTDGAKANCTAVQAAARPAGSSYAASNMGLGGPADCKPRCAAPQRSQRPR
jgi:hypothetical protein